MSEINLDGILKAQGIKDEFDKKALEAFEKAKAQSDDPSVFESKEKFIEHYNNEIFGTNNTEKMPMDGFLQMAYEKGYLDKDDFTDLQIAVDRNGDEYLSHDESSRLLDSVYESANNSTQSRTETKTVKVQPWGTGTDDCLSRIIANHVDGIKLYSEDYNQYLAKICELNGIKDPNIVFGEVELPELERGADGEIQRDSDGNIKFKE